MRNIRFSPSDSKTAGGCNGCNHHDPSPSAPAYRVWVLSVGSAEVRLCDSCVEILSSLLPKDVAPRPTGVRKTVQVFGVRSAKTGDIFNKTLRESEQAAILAFIGNYDTPLLAKGWNAAAKEGYEVVPLTLTAVND